MALPKINSPIFELTLPSTNQQIKYRPFLVKEQKVLMIAMESDEKPAMMTAVKQIINNCAIDPVDVDKLPIFDLEYFFLRLRAKSIGEEIDFTLRHPTGKNAKEDLCDGTTKFKLNLMDIEVIKTLEHETKIVLDEETGIGVSMRYPDGKMATKFSVEDNYTQIDVATEAIINCIDFIFDKENVYPASDSTKEEKIEFLENLSQDQFIKLTKFFDTMPKLKHTISWKCSKCGEKDEITLEGLSSFFG